MLAEATADITPRRVQLEGGPSLQILEAGAGDPLLLLHGSANTALSMVPLMEQVSGRRVIAPDRPGYGLSEPVAYGVSDSRATAVGVMTDLLDALGLDRVDVMGNSTGGFWSLWLALDRPERLRRIVLAGATPLLPGTRPVLFLRLMTTPLLGDVLEKVMPDPSRSSVMQMMKTFGEAEAVAAYPGIIDSVVATLSDLVASGVMQGETRGVIRGLLGFRPRYRFDQDDLRRVTHPTLLIWGDDDPVGDPEAARRAATMLPDARVEILPTGHSPGGVSRCAPQSSSKRFSPRETPADGRRTESRPTAPNY